MVKVLIYSQTHHKICSGMNHCWFSWHVYALAGHCAYSFPSSLSLPPDAPAWWETNSKATESTQHPFMDKNRGDGGIVTVSCQVFFFTQGPTAAARKFLCWKNSSKVLWFKTDGDLIHLRCYTHVGRTKVTLFVKQESLSRQEGHERYKFIHSPHQERFC